MKSRASSRWIRVVGNLWFVLILGWFYRSHAQTYEEVFSFTGARSVVRNQAAGYNQPLLAAPDGYLYGVGWRGGQFGYGMAYRISPAGEFTPLADFTDFMGGEDGANRLIRGVEGSFYGLAPDGGEGGNGLIYKVTPWGKYSGFAFLNDLGGNSYSTGGAGLVQDTQGNFYGVSLRGGDSNRGTVFKVSPNGRELSIIHNFAGGTTDGAYPNSLVLGQDGILYGTTDGGGADDGGTVFKLAPQELPEILAEFPAATRSTKGWGPGGLLMARDGNLYGVATRGGQEHGVCFRVTPGLPSTFTSLHVFSNGEGTPNLPLVETNDRQLYGTTRQGEDYPGGTVFRISPTSGEFGVVYSFPEDYVDEEALQVGSYPAAGLAVYHDGNLYGTTSGGGENMMGTIFKVTPGGSLTTVFHFSNSQQPTYFGSKPMSLALGPDGDFYGGTDYGGIGGPGGYGATGEGDGTIFRINPAGEIDLLVSLDPQGGGENRGTNPICLIKNNDGNLYGITSGGGHHGGGTLFQMTPSGDIFTLEDFGPEGDVSDGTAPQALVEDGSGNLYGICLAGGIVSPNSAVGNGTVFKIGVDGQFHTLARFSGNGGESKGQSPSCLIRGGNGVIYGATYRGGASGHGTIFKIRPDDSIETLVELNDTGASVESDEQWRGIPIGKSQKQFRLGFVATPFTNPMDAVSGLSSGLADAESDLACALRFAPTGRLEVLNGNTYQADTTITYMYDEPYQVEMIVDLTARTYSVKVDGVMLASGYQLRPGVATNQPLDTLMVNCTTGNHSVTLAREGKYPNGLTWASDGNLYGTTSGEYLGIGAAFRLSPAGFFTQLATFNPFTVGMTPQGLIEGPDGNLYGTTYRGGIGLPEDYHSPGSGTVFRMTKSGAVDVVFDFSADPIDGNPTTPLVKGPDGNLYGATDGADEDNGYGNGAIYRIVFDGPPGIYELKKTEATSGEELLLSAKVNPRGSPTSVYLEYGRSPGSFGEPELIVDGLGGRLATVLSARATSLIPGERYYYQFRAVNEHGTTTSEESSFVALAKPEVSALPVSDPTRTGAVLKASVKSFTYATTVQFEIGTDGDEFETIPGSSRTVSGTEPLLVPYPIAGLTEGVTYYYRAVATNAGGTSTSGTQSFTTRIEPLVITGGNSPESSIKVNVSGKVDPRGSDTSASFQYREKGSTAPPWVALVAQGPIIGSGFKDVTAQLNVQQGKVYEYRLVATSAGGSAGGGEDDPWAELITDIVSGLVQSFPNPLPAGNAALSVQLNPPGIGAWRLRGEIGWRLPGVTVGGLAPGPRTIEFLEIPGYASPAPAAIDIASNQTRSVTRSYAGTGGVTGSLTVTLEPPGLTTTDVPEAERLQWRIESTPEGPWQNSGTTIPNLPAGAYRIQCKNVPTSGLATPAAKVVVVGGQIPAVVMTYASTSHDLEAAGFQVFANRDLPHAYVGQISTRAGTGSGVVVQRRAVATAAHVIFDDRIMGYLPSISWLHQRDAGEREPVPQSPRGYYVLSGYAEQRRAENTPGVSKPLSQNRDCAVLYFLEDAARGGYAGYLASEAGDANEFMGAGPAKFLAGYPAQGIPAADLGKLHATPVSTAGLQATYGETWSSSVLLGVPGCSGGPLFVQHESGAYLPAAIYLGGSGQSSFRAFDREMADLFIRADESGAAGGNGTGGGDNYTNTLSDDEGGSLGSVTLQVIPSPLANATRWRLHNGSSAASSLVPGVAQESLSPGSYTIEMDPLPGYLPPQPLIIDVIPGSRASYTYTYEEIAGLADWRELHFGSRNNTGPGANSADPDQDGTSNIDEYTAGTEPLNRSDVFEVADCARSGNTFAVRVAAKPGRLYSLERATDLVAGRWTEVDQAGPLPAGTLLELSETPAPAASGIYRVRVVKE